MNKNEIVEAIVEETKETSSQNIEVLKQIKTYTDNEQKYLAKIQENMQFAQQRKKQIIQEGYQSYISDLQYKNKIIASHNSSLNYTNSRGVQFWKSQTDSNIYYRINKYGKRKKLNSQEELYSELGVHIHIYDTLDKVQLFTLGTNVLLFVSEWFTKIDGDVFDPISDLEWLMYKNNLQYRNTFQYTSYLQKRNIRQQIYQIRNNINQKQSMYAPMQQVTSHMQSLQPQLFHIFPSILNNLFLPDNTENQIQYLESLLTTEKSPIENFIQVFAKDDYEFRYIMNWLARFFQTFNKSSMALVLIGDSETTDIFINKIIKPIFAYRDEYLSTINDDMLKKKQEVILKDRIFYHLDTDNLSNDTTMIKNTSQLLMKILKTNHTSGNQMLDNNKSYIFGELIISSSKDSPFPFLKDIFSRCSVFKVKSIDSILKHANIDYFMLEEYIEKDLDNFSRILAQYTLDNNYLEIVKNSEKELLHKMKNGILMTPELDNNIEIFIQNIQKKNLPYFRNIQKEDSEMYDELVHSFNENMIAQSILYEYFNLIHEDIIFSDNDPFLNILKSKAEFFKKTPSDKFKYKNKKRYVIPEDNT